MRLPKHCLQQVALCVRGYPNSSQHQQVTQLMHMPCRRARGVMQRAQALEILSSVHVSLYPLFTRCVGR